MKQSTFFQAAMTEGNCSGIKQKRLVMKYTADNAWSYICKEKGVF